MRIPFFIFFLLISTQTFGQEITIGNDRIRRTLAFDGEGWRTVRLSDKMGRNALEMKSEEFHILPIDSDQGYSIEDFAALGQPETYQAGDTSFVRIAYLPKPKIKGKSAVPDTVRITYFAVKGESHLRKNIVLEFSKTATVDRLEVERFEVDLPAAGGGRGEPVFIAGQWFTGLEYPAGYSRHTDGNTPADYSRHYEKVGNYSFIDLAGRDLEPKATRGMVRLMHFPGFAVGGGTDPFTIVSKTAVCGSAEAGSRAEDAFMRYLATVWKAPKSFLHYNNWFEPRAKDLSGDALVDIWKEFRKYITPYGVKMDAMVVDDGWQDRKSIWQPSPKYFPQQWESVRALSRKLQNEGVNFGFWLSLNGYTNDIDWGVKQGYREAVRNAYFKQYGRYYSLSSDLYKKEVLRQIPFIVQQTDAVYFKHDFNELSDTGSGNGHPATDRHGHEANLDAAIEILLATRKVKPEILQNLTNWIWFSPWWLMYADYLWMLAGDDGTNGNWPELSTRAMASTDRDTYLWRMWGKPADRPLVPISRLMTHGIIKTSDGRMEGQDDTVQDWLEYVVMHYGRGTLLKEWYISPSALEPEDWKALCTVDNWARENRNILNSMTFVGGRPDEGNAYGYTGWHQDEGILVARNTRAETQKLLVPIDASTGFLGKAGEKYSATVLFPYREVHSKVFKSGETMGIELPGYATMVFSFQKGKRQHRALLPKPWTWKAVTKRGSGMETSLDIPADVSGRCDLLLIGYPQLPAIKVDGESVSPKRTSVAKLNNFARYARSGMLSEKARKWAMQSVDLLPYKGKRITIGYDMSRGFESHILAERSVKSIEPKAGEANQLWPITNGTRRETLVIYRDEEGKQ